MSDVDGTFVQLDGPTLPFENDSFDAVISLLSWRYLDWDPVLLEIARASYLASVDLAKEKGAFPLFDADAYLASGEWEGKAGGYAIQGAASVFVTQVEGSLSNVVGLPLEETLTMLGELEENDGSPAACEDEQISESDSAALAQAIRYHDKNISKSRRTGSPPTGPD